MDHKTCFTLMSRFPLNSTNFKINAIIVKFGISERGLKLQESARNKIIVVYSLQTWGCRSAHGHLFLLGLNRVSVLYSCE